MRSSGREHSGTADSSLIVSAGVLRREGQEREGHGTDLAKREGQGLKGWDSDVFPVYVWERAGQEREGQDLALAKREGHPACPSLKGRDKETMVPQ